MYWQNLHDKTRQSKPHELPLNEYLFHACLRGSSVHSGSQWAAASFFFFHFGPTLNFNLKYVGCLHVVKAFQPKTKPFFASTFAA